jgi:hypothetical protein
MLTVRENSFPETVAKTTREGFMSASHFPVVRAMSVQAATALARYERHVRKLAATWLDMELYTVVSAEIDEIQRACAGLPELSLPWTELLISHAELIHALWRGGPAPDAGTVQEVEERLRDHLACIDTLARRCLRLADRRSGGTVPRH